MTSSVLTGPDNTAVRTALWRALHVEFDDTPSVFDDVVGAELIGDPRWRRRGDMDPQRTRSARGSIVARARFVEDLLVANPGAAGHYVILGAGLDTLAQRRPDIMARTTVFEVDQPATQEWKQGRLEEIGQPVPDSLRFVPTDFENPRSWWEALGSQGFRTDTKAVVTSLGVSMYLTDDANRALLDQLSCLAPGSIVVITVQVPIELVEPPDRAGRRSAEHGARRVGTPFRTFHTPADMISMAMQAGFGHAEHVSSRTLADRYFADREDGLRPSSAEQLVVLTR